MSEMIDRITKAMVEYADDESLNDIRARDLAIVALKALRGPTKEMYDAAMPHMDSWSSNGAWWEAMIDAALSSSKPKSDVA